MKNKLILFAIVMSLIFFPFAVHAEETKYVGVQYIDGQYYYFDNNGNKQYGVFHESNGKTYYYGRWTGARQYDYWLDWDRDGKSDYYIQKDGTKAIGVKEVDNQYYYFDNDGKLQYGVFHESNGKTYYYGRWTGARQYDYWLDWDRDGKSDYYIQKDGTKAIGVKEVDNQYYYFDNDGKIQYGVTDGTYYYGRWSGTRQYNYIWDVEQDGKYDYYFGEDGKKVTNYWLDNNSDEKYDYYFGSDGMAINGVNEIDGKYYYFINSVVQYGATDGTYYYGKATGTRQYNYWWDQNFDGKNDYYFGADGKKVTGFQEIDSKHYCFDDNGKLQYGVFKTIDGNTYYYGRATGTRQYGWIFLNGNAYFFDLNTGIMATGAQTIDNVNYIFNEDGTLRDGFTTDTEGHIRYYFPDGSFANDWITIAGTKYFFNSLGNMIGKNVKKVIDVSAHQDKIDWDTVKREGNIDGVILRIAAGCEEEDVQLAYNVQELKRLGIPYGIYIYSYAENYYEGQLYADFTIKTIEKYNLNPTYGIFFDLESNNITSYLDTAAYEQIVRGYMERMTNSGYGNITKIYTYKSYAEETLNSPYLKSLITWIAQYNHYCTYSGNYSAWQYSSSEKIPGITTNVDVSVWF